MGKIRNSGLAGKMWNVTTMGKITNSDLGGKKFPKFQYYSQQYNKWMV